MKRTLNVYLDTALVGQLSQDNEGRMRFAYNEKWLTYPNAIALSQSLPLRASRFTPKECKGFFDGILPEQKNRELIAKILGVSPNNDYAMLEQIGGECAGAVSFLPPDVPFPAKEYAYHSLSEKELVSIIGRLPNEPLLAGEPGIRLSLAGAQNKIAVHVDAKGKIALPLNGAPSTHILKPAIGHFPNIVSNEALCLELANAVGIPAANAQVGSAGGKKYLLVQRYDRLPDANLPYPKRLHQEDFCQALGISSEHKYQLEGGPSLKQSFELLRNASTLPARDIQRLFNLVIFNTIIGNHDAHGKNFSLLYSKGSTRLAPAYDVLSTVYYPQLTAKMAMRIGKTYESVHLRLSDFEQFADEAGLSASAIAKHIAALAEEIRAELPVLKKKYAEVADLIKLIDERAISFIHRMQIKQGISFTR